MQEPKHTSQLVLSLFTAYTTKDRATAERLLSRDFTFTSPLDDHIDRAAYFERCWPNSDKIRRFTIETIIEDGNEAFVTYRAERTHDGVQFRNTEHVVVEGDKIKAVDVYFGRELKGS